MFFISHDYILMAHTYFALFCKIYEKVGAEDSIQFLFVQLFALVKELHFS